ncbi:MAG: hypothetical protein FWF81_08670 [Defluviitaleaceae bacterium]|nr:hypothetical protein [Defluviitaleaceae bacterium]
MTNTTHARLSQEVLNASEKSASTTQQLNHYTNNAENGRKQYELTISKMEIEEQAKKLQQQLTQNANDDLSILASMITIHGLKVASRGRLLLSFPKTENPTSYKPCY